MVFGKKIYIYVYGIKSSRIDTKSIVGYTYTKKHYKEQTNRRVVSSHFSGFSHHHFASCELHKG